MPWENSAWADRLNSGKWTLSNVDGLPENPNADPNCSNCKGHGVIAEAAWCWDIMKDCPKCIRKPDKNAEYSAETRGEGSGSSAILPPD